MDRYSVQRLTGPRYRRSKYVSRCSTSYPRLIVCQTDYPNLISTSKWQGSLPKPRPRPSIAMGNVGSILGGLSGLMLVIDVIVYVKYRERMREREAEITRNTAAPRQGKRYGKPYFAPSLRNSALGEPVGVLSPFTAVMFTPIVGAAGLHIEVTYDDDFVIQQCRRSTTCCWSRRFYHFPVAFSLCAYSRRQCHALCL